jgi:tetratricopeptide (TPR) repeat protein
MNALVTIEDMFEGAIKLRDNGKPENAIKEFLKIIDMYPNDSKIGGVYTTLAGVYDDLNDYNNSLVNFKRATELNPKSELASLGLYLSYVKLNNYEMAINELKRYLDIYPAGLYKDTLEELLGDMKDGYALKYKDTIMQLAKINGLVC